MSRDSSRTQLHLHCSHHADLFEEFTRLPLAPDTIFLPPEHQPINPEDEDDVVPDQHAAFGITKATRETREPAWRDLRLNELANAGGDARQENGTQAGWPTNIGINGIAGRTQQQQEQQPVIGPARGQSGVPIGVRQGMRAIGTNGGAGSSLRG